MSYMTILGMTTLPMNTYLLDFGSLKSVEQWLLVVVKKQLVIMINVSTHIKSWHL